MHMTRSMLVLAGILAMAGAPALRAGDYDRALFVLSRAFPEVRSVAVFYDQYSTLMNQLEFEGSASKEYGISVKLVPLDGKQRITTEMVRKLCHQNHLQGILLMEGDTLIKPGSTAAGAVLSMGGSIPVGAIQPVWLKDGAWFAAGPEIQGVQIGPKVKKPDTILALKAAGEAMAQEGK